MTIYVTINPRARTARRAAENDDGSRVHVGFCCSGDEYRAASNVIRFVFHEQPIIRGGQRHEFDGLARKIRRFNGVAAVTVESRDTGNNANYVFLYSHV